MVNVGIYSKLPNHFLLNIQGVVDNIFVFEFLMQIFTLETQTIWKVLENDFYLVASNLS